MSRFNITIILACVLLAMLLWIVRSTVGEWTNPEPLVVLEEAPEVIEFDPGLPVISSAPSLMAYLDDAGLDGRMLLEGLELWRLSRRSL